MTVQCRISASCALAFLLTSGVHAQFFSGWNARSQRQQGLGSEVRFGAGRGKPSLLAHGHSVGRGTWQDMMSKEAQREQRSRFQAPGGSPKLDRAEMKRIAAIHATASNPGLRGGYKSAEETLDGAIESLSGGMDRANMVHLAAQMGSTNLHMSSDEWRLRQGVLLEKMTALKKLMAAGNGVFARPMLIHAGSNADLSSGQGVFSRLPLHEIFEKSARDDDPLQRFHQNLFAALDSQMQSQRPSNGFYMEDKDGHVRLRASLPGYKMPKKGMQSFAVGADGQPEEQPLSVEVVGDSLVVRGRQDDGQMLKTWQRSYRLPGDANTDAMKVTYSVSDGGLAVEVPRGSTPEEEGSQTTLVLTDGADVEHLNKQNADKSDAEAETPAAVAQDLVGLSTDSTPSVAPASEDFPDEAAAPVVAPPVVAPPVAAAPTVAGDGFSLGAESSSSIPMGANPVVVQRAGSKPFWRLVGNDGGRHSSVEVVLPEGWEMGEPSGKVISFLGGGSMELPVSISSADCNFLEGSASGSERVLQCKIQDSTVKKLTIDVTDEL